LFDFLKRKKKDSSDLQGVWDAVLAFNNDASSAETIEKEAQAALGEDWLALLQEKFNGLDEEKKKEIGSKLQNFVSYKKALQYWYDATDIVQGTKQISTDDLRNQITDFEKELERFGESGNDLVEKLKAKLLAEPTSESVPQKQPQAAQPLPEKEKARTPQSPAEKATAKDASKDANKDVSKDVKWYLNHFLEVSQFYEQSKSILGMICVKQGGIPLEEYRYYGFLNDVIDHLMSVGKELQSHKGNINNPVKLRQVILI